MNKDNYVEVKNPNFRPGTKTEKREVIFDFRLEGKKSAAMGDMICWLPAIEYIAENYNYVLGHLIVPQFFMQVAARVMSRFPHWKLHTEIPDRMMDGFPIKRQLEFPINATGMHLMDLGFVYYAHMNPPPEGAKRYPILNLKGIKLPKDLRGLRYAVMTPIIEANTRRMTADAFNGVVEHLNKIGITPVFLGKLGMDGRHGSIDPKYDLTRGLNLIDKTSLLEAAFVLDQAEMVIGIDNGLLHLAAMTPATILYGFTMVGPEHRRIYRKHGWTVELYPDKEKLPCLFCQERVRYFFAHNFENCIYQENTPQCVQALNKESWIANIDMVIKEQNENRRRMRSDVRSDSEGTIPQA